MKNTHPIKILLALTFLMLHAMNSYANAASDRTILRDKLKFYYIANPNNTTSVLLNNTRIFDGTETGAFWTNNNMRRAQALVRALLRDRQNGGDTRLQSLAARIIKIINKPVIVYLYDDVAALTAMARTNWSMCLDNPSAANPKVWPCANNQSSSDDWDQNIARCMGRPVPARSDDRWAGFMHLGAHHLNANQLSWTKGTFIHELVHTQDLSDSRMHLFWVNGSNYRYGLDGTHFTTEAVPNMAMTYKEGIANTITLLYEGNVALQRFNWFSNNSNLWVEINPNPVNTGPGSVHRCLDATTPSNDAWLYNQIIASGIAEQRRNTAGTYAAFRIRDLQPKFIVHNEFILALIFSEYARHISLNKFMEALQTSNNNLWRVSASGVAVLFENMCTVGLPVGETLGSVSASGLTGPKNYLLPLAFADYFTAYRATNKNEFKAIFENMLPQGWIDLYWDSARTTVRTAVPITATPQWGDLTSIAIALGITQSIPD